MCASTQLVLMPPNHAGKCLSQQGAERLVRWVEGVSPVAAGFSKLLHRIPNGLVVCKDNRRAVNMAKLCKKQ